MKSRPSESSSTAWAWTCRWWATSTTAWLLTQFPECAQALSKYRINPGNMGGGKRRDDNFAQMIEVACRYDKPVRIGVNWGSLDHELMARKMDENNQRAVPWEAQAVMRDALVVSAISNAQRAEELGLRRDAIILSCKVSHVQDLIAVYRDLSARCDYPLHLGLTEAGMGSKGIVASTAALAVLLQQGIGDTIRISLTPEPGGDRSREAVVAQEILQTMGLRAFTPLVVACRVAAAPAARSSRSWPTASSPICDGRCLCGARSIRASRT